MKKIFVSVVIALLCFSATAQLITPGTGVRWDRDSLLALGALSPSANGNFYTLLSSVTISATDTVEILTNDSIRIVPGALITVLGVLNIDPPAEAVISCSNPAQKFLGFRFEDTDGSVWNKATVLNAGGIKLVNSDVTFNDCEFKYFDKANSTGTIDAYQSRPVITNCSFIENAGPAVASGANAASSPQIRGCYIYHNNTSNANTPQINLGTMGSDTIRIIGNIIDGFYNMGGGIAVSTLTGGQVIACIDSNTIINNRYGIASIGSNCTTFIRHNYIADNNIQGIPAQGGSGINFNGSSSNVSTVSHNEITGNLWGITIQVNAVPNLGQIQPDTTNIGWNKIYLNGNSGSLYNLYNNTPGNIKAENNYWGSYINDTVEEGIFHQVDDGSLGLVDFLPLSPLITEAPHSLMPQGSGMVEVLFPNPSSGTIIIRLAKEQANDAAMPVLFHVMAADGRLLASYSVTPYGNECQLELSDLPAGFYFLRTETEERFDVTPFFLIRN